MRPEVSKCPTYRPSHIWTTFGNSRNFQTQKSHISLYILKIIDFETSKITKFEQILSIFYSFLRMSKIAQYFDYIDLRPPQGVSKSEVFLKRPPPKPPPSSRWVEKPPKTDKNGQFLAVFRASGPKHPYSSRSKGGPPQGASPKMVKKGPKMTQNRPL